MIFTSIGALSLIISNIVFVIYYKKDIVGKDVVFEKWLHFFPRTRKLLPVLICLLNFKSAKMLYSGFYGMESCMAKLGKHMVFYRVMRMTTYFSFVFVYGFIFMADVLVFLRIEWGYQLVILAIETCILQVLIICLTCYEFKTPAGELLGCGKN